MSERYLAPLTLGEREALIAAARRYLHVRWRHQGRTMTGVDCVGLLAAAFRDIGKAPSDQVAYGRVPYAGKLQEMLRFNLGDPIPKSAMCMGDIAVMKFKGDPSHVGLLTNYPLGGLALLHAQVSHRSVVEHRLDEQWFGYITEIYRP